MTLNKRIIDTLSPVGYPVDFAKYEGTSDKYIVFNFIDETGDDYADDAPQAETVYIQVHFFAPKTFNHNTAKKNIKNLLFNAGFTYPRVQTLYEDDTKLFHLIFETEYTGGID